MGSGFKGKRSLHKITSADNNCTTVCSDHAQTSAKFTHSSSKLQFLTYPKHIHLHFLSFKYIKPSLCYSKTYFKCHEDNLSIVFLIESFLSYLIVYFFTLTKFIGNKFLVYSFFNPLTRISSFKTCLFFVVGFGLFVMF
jgi:hypothetical protein